ncbi:hypothetical protein LSM04_008341 [Trypanosoma melophagium]|uniref:uncharacterized protein n=1 Tax=Trypanosoma melophagium TaxID=715481 RepID=UPI00351AA5E6|nr:hypothetical protein LSM04_008341 [Trypanosoma melophagium]
MSTVVPVSLQCYMGRHEIPVDLQLTIHDTLRLFRRTVPALGQVNMDEYVVNHNGTLLLDENITLKDAKVGAESVLILVKKTSCPAANNNKDDEE